MEKTFKNLCTPAKIYFGIAVIASIFALFRGISFGAVLIKLIFAFVWTFILGWLCKKGYSYISWFLVLLPFVLLFAIISMVMISQKKKGKRVLIEGAKNNGNSNNGTPSGAKCG